MSGKRYPEEFKTEAVKQVVDRGYSVASVATRLDITTHSLYAWIKKYGPDSSTNKELNRPGFPGECFICELRLPDHRFRWKHNKLFLLLPEEYGPAF
ncbi:transposase, partial [Escherichia coli]|nr:transposase [Escherichia coli]